MRAATSCSETNQGCLLNMATNHTAYVIHAVTMGSICQSAMCARGVAKRVMVMTGSRVRSVGGSHAVWELVLNTVNPNSI